MRERALAKGERTCFRSRPLIPPMKLRRREFLKTSLAASAATAVSASALRAASAPSSGVRELYELRAYKLKSWAAAVLLDGYFEKALVPALTKRGIKNVGVFTEVTVDKKAVTSTPLGDSPVWVLIPHPSFESFVNVAAELNADPSVQQAGADYLSVPKAS